MYRRLSQVGILGARIRSVATSIDSSDLESVGLALSESFQSVSVALSSDKLLEETVRISRIPLEFVLRDITSSSLGNAEHLLPGDDEVFFVSSLLNNRVSHLGRDSEDNNVFSVVGKIRPVTCTNGVGNSNSSSNESLQGHAVRSG